MIQSFLNVETNHIHNGVHNKKALKLLPTHLWKIAYRKFYLLDNAVSLKDLKIPPSNHLEKLKGVRDEQYSIRINNQYRICFKWLKDGPINVEIIDYH